MEGWLLLLISVITETFCDGVKLEFLRTLMMSIFEGSVGLVSFIKGGWRRIEWVIVDEEKKKQKEARQEKKIKEAEKERD